MHIGHFDVISCLLSVASPIPYVRILQTTEDPEDYTGRYKSICEIGPRFLFFVVSSKQSDAFFAFCRGPPIEQAIIKEKPKSAGFNQGCQMIYFQIWVNFGGPLE
jgi:hypothetical protein